MGSLSSFLNVKEVSEYLALKASTVYSLVEEKKIPHYRINRQIRFKKSDIDEWMEKQREEVVEAKVEAMKVIRSFQRKPNLDVDRIMKKVVEQSKKKGYTSLQEKPGRIKGLREEVEDGII